MKRYFLLAVMSVCVAEASVAQSTNALAQLQSFATQTRSARGDFEQKIISSTQSNPPSTGTFAFARPGKFRWSYNKPYEQLLVADGQKLWIYDKDLNQVTVKQLGNALGESPAAILFGNNQLEKNFSLKDVGERDGLAWLEATPKSKDVNFERIEIGFKNSLPAVMRLHDVFGQISELTLRNIVANPNIAADQFVFKPAADVDVFEQ